MFLLPRACLEGPVLCPVGGLLVSVHQRKCMCCVPRCRVCQWHGVALTGVGCLVCGSTLLAALEAEGVCARLRPATALHAILTICLRHRRPVSLLDADITLASRDDGVCCLKISSVRKTQVIRCPTEGMSPGEMELLTALRMPTVFAVLYRGTESVAGITAGSEAARNQG